MKAERLLLVAAPVVAMAVVALGLRMGAGSPVRAAIVFGAPRSAAGTGLAWQVVAFDEDRGVRQPVTRAKLDVTALSHGREARWSGVTNDDGTAEVLLDLPSVEDVHIEVHANGALLAGGEASVSPSLSRLPPTAAWSRYARRGGAIALDVAVLGQRVASGFPSSLWVRATGRASHSALSGVTIEPEPDAALSFPKSSVLTDSRGWGHIVVTTMGYGVALVLEARSRDGDLGDWAGALFASPGAAHIIARDRYLPDERPALDVVMPNARTIAYVEIDDSHGRAWGAAVALDASEREMPRASIRAPKLAPGLYWAVVSGDPAGAAQLGPGTSARPFFVAASDEAALAFGLDEECVPPPDPRETARVVAVCLALAGATPVPRWTALDGFSGQHGLDAKKRARGLRVALGAIIIVLVLETWLLLRAARRPNLPSEMAPEGGNPSLAKACRTGSIGIALFVALLGLALLAAFLVRAA